LDPTILYFLHMLGIICLDYACMQKLECIVSHCRVSLRVSDGYVFVPSDKNSSQISRMDRPELLPSSKRHVWGRLVTLGNFGSKVCVFLCL